SPRGPGGEIQSRVLTQDAQLELLECVSWVDAELFHERPASALEDVERVRLPIAAVQREHQLAAQTLAKRMFRDERLELGHQLVMAAELEVGIDAVLDRSQMELLQPGDLALCERLGRKVGQRLSPPERQGIA